MDKITSLQRNTFDEDNMIAYAWRVRKYFLQATTAIDIGCGIGYQTRRISELVPTVHFDMLDKTGIEQAANYTPVGYAHNDLSLTRQYANSYINGTVYDIDMYNWDTPVDVVISTLSWGWHYPIENYLARVVSLVPKYIILDSRLDNVTIPYYTIIDTFTINRKERTIVWAAAT